MNKQREIKFRAWDKNEKKMEIWEVMKLKSMERVYTDGKKFVVEYLNDEDDELYYREPNNKEAEEIVEYVSKRR